jgi:hypothetical protein
MWDGDPACTGLQITCRKGEPQSEERELRQHHTHMQAQPVVGQQVRILLRNASMNAPPPPPPAPPPPGNHRLRFLPPPPPMGRPPARVRWPMMCTCPARGAPCASEQKQTHNKVTITTQSQQINGKREGGGGWATTNLQSLGVKASENASASAILSEDSAGTGKGA